jgi:uncharacterized GH25 family protein
MKKIFNQFFLLLFVLAVAATFPLAALAHDHWIGVSKVDPGQKATLIRGYGHGFPAGEPIPEGRDSVFTPITIISKDGSKSGVTASAENNFTFISEKALDKGTYVIISEYMPTYISEGPAGRQEKPKKEVPDATSCRHVAMYAKSVVNVGGANENDVITKPQNQKLELIPATNPAGLKVGETVKMTLLYDGKPLPGTAVKGMVDGLPKGVYAFFATTDKEGVINFVPLKAGSWILTTNTKEDFKDKTVCDVGSYTSSLFFNVAAN